MFDSLQVCDVLFLVLAVAGLPTGRVDKPDVSHAAIREIVLRDIELAFAENFLKY